MDETAKKAVLRLFTYGLYVVTCRSGERRNAFTANWLTQVSFDPPLLALSVENTSVSLPMISAAGWFTVCVLERGQRDIAGTLGRTLQRSPAKLEGLNWREAPTSDQETPEPPLVLADSLGWVSCRVESETPAGDSTLLVGRVVAAGLLGPGDPITMREAGFRHSG